MKYYVVVAEYSMPEYRTSSPYIRMRSNYVNFAEDVTENNIDRFFAKVRKIVDADGRTEGEFSSQIISWQKVVPAKNKNKRRRWLHYGNI